MGRYNSNWRRKKKVVVVVNNDDGLLMSMNGVIILSSRVWWVVGHSHLSTNSKRWNNLYGYHIWLSIASSSIGQKMCTLRLIYHRIPYNYTAVFAFDVVLVAVPFPFDLRIINWNWIETWYSLSIYRHNSEVWTNESYYKLREVHEYLYLITIDYTYSDDKNSWPLICCCECQTLRYRFSILKRWHMNFAGRI